MCVVFITRIFFKEYHIYIYIIHDNMKKVQKVVFGKRFKIWFTKIWIVLKRKKTKIKTIKTTHQKEKFKNNNIN